MASLQAIPSLENYGVSSRNGFLPPAPPLPCLPDNYYQPWENVAKELPTLLSEHKLRPSIDELPVLSTDKLQTEAEWQRACLLLGFFTHAYIWGGKTPSERLPPAVVKPFLAVAEHLGITPSATYAVTNLWNYHCFSPDDDISEPENLRTFLTFTGTDDESWFYLVSVAMEARGAPIFPRMLDAIQAARANDSVRVSEHLDCFTEVLKEVTVLLQRMYERCAPKVFYHSIRPFLAGSKNMAAAGLPNGVFYDEGNGKGQWRQYSGGSNAQSSLIQFFDVVLGVQHMEAKTKTDKINKPKSTNNFILEMRDYMPKPHRLFLEHVSSTTNIRQYCLSFPSNHPAREAYNATIAALASLRDVHIQVVSRYIITPSRNAAAAAKSAPNGDTGNLNLATASTNTQKDAVVVLPEETAVASTTTIVGIGETSNVVKVVEEVAREKDAKLHGTGGTTLIPFLKQCRDETRDAAVLESL